MRRRSERQTPAVGRGRGEGPRGACARATPGDPVCRAGQQRGRLRPRVMRGRTPMTSAGSPGLFGSSRGGRHEAPVTVGRRPEAAQGGRRHARG